MALAKYIEVKESLIVLKKLKEQSDPFFLPRIQMLIEMVKRQNFPFSKKHLAILLDVHPNTIQSWRNLYCKGGIVLLLSHQKTGFKPSVITAEEKKMILAVVSEKKVQSYKDLHVYVNNQLKKAISYNTLLKFCHRNFINEIPFGRKKNNDSDQKLISSPYLKKIIMEKIRRKKKKRIQRKK